MDPRSPSQDVKRTPIKLEASSDDPRSPTQNVPRTPIQLYTSETGSGNINGNTNVIRDVRQVLNYENEPRKLSHEKESRERMPLVERNK